jgi:CubicO group peptidase (beta-lactamase class C family)
VAPAPPAGVSRARAVWRQAMTGTTRLMDGFPPRPDGQVTLANWRTSPFNRWAFHHVREILPTADIPNDPARVRELPASPIDLGALSIDGGDGEPLSFGGFLEKTSTDGLVILHRGRLVFEHYANGATAGMPHILMSVSKSLLGLLAGALVGRKELDPDRPVTDVIPEVAGTAYRGATIRQLLDMRAGIAFDEDYLATSGAIVAYRKATGWHPLGPGETPSDLRSFYRALTASAGPHGGPVHYVSPNTDLLGWVIERATGQRYADLMSELFWQPLGAERSAYITVDRLGAPRSAGGFCATARDLARVGQLVMEEGARTGVQIVPASWIEDIVRNGDPGAWAAGDLAAYFPGVPLRYRSHWYVRDGKPPVVFGLGIHGQYVFVDRARGIVIAKVSSQALPIDAERITLTLRAVSRIMDSLAASSR